ncbi:MAG: hypothetical protein IK016_11115 [Lachnospiraceae bacterium]|nr:hypothetical protein [Lachnospiraceae bacterium]
MSGNKYLKYLWVVLIIIWMGICLTGRLLSGINFRPGDAGMPDPEEGTRTFRGMMIMHAPIILSAVGYFWYMHKQRVENKEKVYALVMYFFLPYLGGWAVAIVFFRLILFVIF